MGILLKTRKSSHLSIMIKLELFHTEAFSVLLYVYSPFDRYCYLKGPPFYQFIHRYGITSESSVLKQSSIKNTVDVRVRYL